VHFSPRTVSAALAIGLLGLVGACARQGAPPGGPEDRRPPVVVSTEPDTFAVMAGFRGPVRFRFDERISERPGAGTYDDAVLVSPRTGDVRVGHGRTSLTVEIDGGFLPGRVYRVTLLPVVRDLFSNQMGDPFELVFSTGGTPVESAVAGLVWDRVTGQGVDALDVRALSTEDSTVYVARTDTGGVYAFRYLGPSRYRIMAFQDRNQNGEADPMELQGEQRMRLTGPDTLFLDIPVLQPDTTPAHLVAAQALDSVTVMLEFDDYLDPVEPVRMSVDLAREDGEAPVLDELFHEHEYVDWLRAVQDSFTRLDSLEALRRERAAATAAVDTLAGADTARAALDTLGVAGDTAARRAPAPQRPEHRFPPTLPSGRGGTATGAVPTGPGEEPDTPDGNPLPSRRVVARLRGPLEANVAYQLTVRAVANLNRIPMGGGEAALVLEPPVDSAALADSLARDTAAADTSGVPPDTGSFVLPRLRQEGGDPR
jgi:hypothetical protein